MDVKKRFSEEQIIGFLREADKGVEVKELLAESMLENEVTREALRYRSSQDRNRALRERIVALAQRHRRYGAGMRYSKLRQSGELINHKRVERLYRLEKLQIRRRPRKKIPVAGRQPLIRPGKANERIAPCAAPLGFRPYAPASRESCPVCSKQLIKVTEADVRPHD